MFYKRKILGDIRKWIHRDEILILTGPRQSGKTTLLKMLQSELEEKKLKVFFFNLEDFEILKFLNETPLNLLKLIHNVGDEKKIVILDEIQYLRNPTNFLKFIYDEYGQYIKLIVSGSSAFYLDKKFKDSLAGRKKVFYILPLSFYDFLIFKGSEYLASEWENISPLEFSKDKLNILDQRHLNNLIEEYIIFGGYPKVVLEKDQALKIELLKEILNSYIKKDIIESEIRYQEHFYTLLKILASQIGSLVNENDLSNTLGISTTSIKNYLYTMQKSFHLRLVRPFYRNVRKEISRMQKSYFIDTGLRNTLLNQFEPLSLRLDKGILYENFVYKTLIDFYGIDLIKFWRSQSKSEVDFIIESEQKAVEVKYQLSFVKIIRYLKFLSDYDQYKFTLICHKTTLKEKKDKNNIEVITI